MTDIVSYSYCFAELSPVCAVTGGILGQEIIKVGLGYWNVLWNQFISLGTNFREFR